MNNYYEYIQLKQRKASWIGHILCRVCHLTCIIEGKIEGMGRRGRRCKQLLDDLKKTRSYWKLKQEALDLTVWRTALEEAMDLL
jgi:hypothetical protein